MDVMQQASSKKAGNDLFLAALEAVKTESQIDRAYFDRLFVSMQEIVNQISNDMWQLRKGAFKRQKFDALISVEHGTAGAVVLENISQDVAQDNAQTRPKKETPSRILTLNGPVLRALLACSCGAKPASLFDEAKQKQHELVTSIEREFSLWIVKKLPLKDIESAKILELGATIPPKLSVLEFDVQSWTISNLEGTLVLPAFSIAMLKGDVTPLVAEIKKKTSPVDNIAWQNRIRDALDIAPISLSASISVEGYSLTKISKLQIGEDLSLPNIDHMRITLKAGNKEVCAGTGFVSHDRLGLIVTSLRTATIAALPVSTQTEGSL